MGGAPAWRPNSGVDERVGLSGRHLLHADRIESGGRGGMVSLDGNTVKYLDFLSCI